MTDDLIIERISDENFNDFLHLIEKLAEYEKLQPPAQEARDRLRTDGLAKDPKYEAYLGKLDNKAVAYIIYFFNYSSFLALPTLYLEDIFVLEEYRRQGIGKKMFAFCKERAKESGCGRIELCVLTWNEPAIQFYSKNDAERLDWYFYRINL
jgi:GNAT superfamily N-acetyltransferase